MSRALTWWVMTSRKNARKQIFIFPLRYYSNCESVYSFIVTLFIPYLVSAFSDVMMGWIRVLSELLFFCFTKHWIRLTLLRDAVTVKPNIFPRERTWRVSEMCKWNETEDYTVLRKVIPCTLVIDTNVSDETSGARMLTVYLSLNSTASHSEMPQS
jgi:hypothetical protein